MTRMEHARRLLVMIIGRAEPIADVTSEISLLDPEDTGLKSRPKKSDAEDEE